MSLSLDFSLLKYFIFYWKLLFQKLEIWELNIRNFEGIADKNEILSTHVSSVKNLQLSLEKSLIPSPTI